MKDRIIFWLDADLKPFVLAKFLQEKYDSEFYAVIDITNRTKKFFQDQNIVNFKKIWYYHDHISMKKKPNAEYLESIEKKYNINLWIVAQNERLFYKFNDYYKFNRDEILTILEQECKLFDQILEEIKPDFLIIKTTDFHNNHLFYEMCRSKGVKILMHAQARLGYRCTISENLDKFDFEEDLSTVNATGKTFDELLKYLKEHDVSKQILNFKNKFISSKSERLKAAYQFLLVANNNNVKTHYTYFGRSKLIVLFKEIQNLIIERQRKKFLNRYCIKKVNDEVPLIYYPLQSEPERSLLIAAPFYTNQLATIKNIAMSLPPNYKLCVKEHPYMKTRGWRDISFYKQIMEIPNVELIHPLVSPEEMMRKCSLVITISGTGAMEAAFYQKPSIVFLSMNYTILPSVHWIKSIEELPDAIRQSLQKNVQPSDLEKFVKIYEKNSFEFDLLDLQIAYTDYFYYGGFLVDVDIPITKMESFLQEHKEMLEKFAMEHIKKIKQHKEH